MRGKVGVNTLRKHYGTNQRNGTQTEHNRMAAGKCIRYVLIELEKAGLVGKITVENDNGSNSVIGKTLTKKGTTDMDRIASQISKELKKKQ
jgi:ribosomal protein S19E (S16A)